MTGAAKHRRAVAALQTLVAGWLVLIGLLATATAAELPALTGRIVDNAGLLDPQAQAALTQKLEAFENRSSDQIVVATIESLDGEALEPFANRLFRHWGLGQAGENNGVLLLVSRDDRKIRIEVGYGLEGTLTDLHSKLIIENTIVPAFRGGDFSGGITRGADDIIAVLSGNAAELEARAERNQEPAEDPVPWPVFVFFFFFFILVGGSVIFSLLASIFGRKLGPGRYKWLGVTVSSGGTRSGSSSRGSWSSGGGGFSGGGGSSGGGGASGSW